MSRGDGTKGGDAKPRYTKSNLPTKVCATCNRRFAWRKKWERVWAEVKFCSERCRKAAKAERA
jgi:hypothetical protein